ncbi:MAG: hypothetical protein ABJQ29_03115 [Luteolibacter sp.]
MTFWSIILRPAGLVFIFWGLRSLNGSSQLVWACVMIAIGIHHLTFIPQRFRNIGKSTFSNKPDEHSTTHPTTD